LAPETAQLAAGMNREEGGTGLTNRAGDYRREAPAESVEPTDLISRVQIRASGN